MIEYSDIKNAASQLFNATNDTIHPFFRARLSAVFAACIQDHATGQNCADTQTDVLNDNLDLMEKTITLCKDMRKLNSNSLHNGQTSEWIKFGKRFAANGKLMAILEPYPALGQQGWRFERCIEHPESNESASFTLENRPHTIDRLFFNGPRPNDYAILCIMQGLECLKQPTPLLWNKRTTQDAGLKPAP